MKRNYFLFLPIALAVLVAIQAFGKLSTLGGKNESDTRFVTVSAHISIDSHVVTQTMSSTAVIVFMRILINESGKSLETGAVINL